MSIGFIITIKRLFAFQHSKVQIKNGIPKLFTRKFTEIPPKNTQKVTLR